MAANLISIGAVDDEIVRNDGFSVNELDRFASPGSLPWGIGYNGVRLFSSDALTDLFYEHDEGIVGSINSSFAPAYANPRSCTVDDTYFYGLTSFGTHRAIRYPIFASTPATELQPGGDLWGLTITDEYMYLIDDTANTITKYDIFTTDVVDSIATPGTSPHGVTTDHIRMYSADIGTDLTYKHDDGFLASIESSIASGDAISTSDITWEDFEARMGRGNGNGDLPQVIWYR